MDLQKINKFEMTLLGLVRCVARHFNVCVIIFFNQYNLQILQIKICI